MRLEHHVLIQPIDRRRDSSERPLDRRPLVACYSVALAVGLVLLSSFALGQEGLQLGTRTVRTTAGAGILSQPVGSRAGSRASAKQVSTVMALLAAFQDAGALPPEDSPDANRLIKALIQFQSAFMKSDNQAVRQFFHDALAAKPGDQAEAAIESFRSDGWTSRSLEAVVDYAATHPLQDRPELQVGLGFYNVGVTDLDLLSRTFRTARSLLAARGRDLHQVYDARRREMPGVKH
ncbi:MAG: hypothetical protein EPO64_00905 [Nitrospirae bacterium]|nr:MAG: hypothetical protein EPO64_00905 [Nitrospirota bacterium]